MFPKPKFNGKFSRTAKYNEVSTKRDNIHFASKLEAATYDYLKNRELAGEIRIIQCQKHVKLTRAAIVAIPDFYLQDIKTGEFFFAESKGFETERWLIVLKLWRKYGPGRLEIYKGNYKKIYLAEVVIPDLVDEQLSLKQLPLVAE